MRSPCSGSLPVADRGVDLAPRALDVALDVDAVGEVDVDVGAQLALFGAQRRRQPHVRRLAQQRQRHRLGRWPQPSHRRPPCWIRTRHVAQDVGRRRAPRRRECRGRSARAAAAPRARSRRSTPPVVRSSVTVVHRRRVDVQLAHRLVVGVEVDPVLAAQRFEHRAARPRDALDQRAQRRADDVQPLRIRRHDADPDRRAHAGRHHVHARARWRGPGRGPAGQAHRLVQLVDQLGGRARREVGPHVPQDPPQRFGRPARVPAHAPDLGPLRSRPQANRRLGHRVRRRVGAGVGAARPCRTPTRPRRTGSWRGPARTAAATPRRATRPAASSACRAGRPRRRAAGTRRRCAGRWAGTRSAPAPRSPASAPAG